jgi:VanZ family protein
MNKKLIFTIITSAYLIVLLLGAFAFQVGTGESGTPGVDKVLHFIGFFILTVLLLLTFQYYKLNYRFVACFLIALGIGILIEAIQLGIPGREFSLWDLAADAAGILMALVLRWSFAKH